MSATPPSPPPPPPPPLHHYLCLPCNTTFPTLLAALTHRLDSAAHTTSLPARTSLAPVLLSLAQHTDIVAATIHTPTETTRLKETDLAQILMDQVSAALPSSSIRSAIKNIVTTPQRGSRTKIVKLTAQDNRTRNTQNFFPPPPAAAAATVTLVVKMCFTPPQWVHVVVPTDVASGGALLAIVAPELDKDAVWELARRRWAFDLRPLKGEGVAGRVKSDADVLEIVKPRDGVWYRKMEIG